MSSRNYFHFPIGSLNKYDDQNEKTPRSTKLAAADYFCELPSQLTFLNQLKLDALREKIEKMRAHTEKKEKEDGEQEQFIRGLMGL